MTDIFHSIDCEVYTKLVIHLDRDPEELMKVLAFWLWLEQSSLGFANMVERIGLLPHNIINEGKFLLSFHFTTTLKFDLAQGKGYWICRRFCLTDCDDLMMQAIQMKQTLLMGFSHSVASSSLGTALGVGAMGLGPPSDSQTPIDNDVIYGPMTDPSLSYTLNYDASGAGVAAAPLIVNPVVAPAAANVEHPDPLGMVHYAPFDRVNQHIVVDEELAGLMSHLHLPFDEEVPREGELKSEVASDERTISLTLSNSFPISREDVSNFFTRRHTDIIEEGG
ncbi:hypothetical protein RJ641_005466 [Dillenia turbinata]|uniref:Uncharacterized protein n=1 Tax=Dillenia turbinata TaxID=194707 RepID=A0AAN8VG76_9MAGN